MFEIVWRVVLFVIVGNIFIQMRLNDLYETQQARVYKKYEELEE